MKKTNILFFLVLLLSSIKSFGIEAIVNGNFYQSTGWYTYGDFYYDTKWSWGNSKPGYAYCTNTSGLKDDNLYGELYQSVTLPSNTTAATFDFYYWIITEETQTGTINDYLEIVLIDQFNSVVSRNSISNLDGNKSNYAAFPTISIPKSLYGTTFTVAFAGKTNGSLKTLFRIDDVSLNYTTGSGSCVNWASGNKPSNQIITDATEFLCSEGIIDGNSINASDLNGHVTLLDACRFVNDCIDDFNGYPSDYFPNLHSDFPQLGTSDYHDVNCMLFLDHGDGISPLTSDYHFLALNYYVPKEKVLRLLMEAFNYKPDFTDFNKNNGGTSYFLCDLAVDNPYFGYAKVAYFNYWLDHDLSNCSGGCLNQRCMGLNTTRADLYVWAYYLIKSVGYPSVEDKEFYTPNTFDKSNISSNVGIDRGVFSDYSENCFNFSESIVPVEFSYSYQSNVTEYPILHFEGYDRNYQRIYYARNAINPLGRGWSHSYHTYIQPLGDFASTTLIDKQLFIHWGNGPKHLYNLSTNAYETKGVYDEININKKDASGNALELVIKTKDQVQYLFSRPSGDLILFLQEIKDRNGNKITLNYENSNARSLQFYWGQSTRLANVKESISGRVLKFKYSASNDFLESVEDNTGRIVNFRVNPITENLENYTNPVGSVTQYFYGQTDLTNNLLESIRRPNGNEIRNDYYKRKLKQTKASSYTIDIDYSPDFTNSGFTSKASITTYQDGQSLNTSVAHNYFGNVVNVTNGSNNFTFEYSDSKNSTLPTKIIDQNCSISTFLNYDSKGNNTGKFIDAGTINTNESYTYTAFNDIKSYVDRKGKQTDYDYDSKGNLIQSRQSGSEITTISRGSFGEVTSIQNPSGIKTDYTYNKGEIVGKRILGSNVSESYTRNNRGLVTKTTDGAGKSLTFEYDDLDNISNYTAGSGTINLKTSYVYDRNENLISILNPKGNRTLLTYDFNTDDLIQEEYGGFAKDWTFNNDGSIKTFSDKNAFARNYIYFPKNDSREGLLKSDGVVDLDYFSNTKQLKSISLASTPSINYTFSYDRLLRLTQSKTSEVKGQTVQYEYDDNDNITKITYPTGDFFVYTFDHLNRNTEIKDKNGKSLIQYTYLKDGRISSTLLGNNTRIDYHFDRAGRQDSIHYIKSDGSTIAKYGCLYDGSGNILEENRIENFGNTQSWKFTNSSAKYDFTDRLIDFDGNTVSNKNNGSLEQIGKEDYGYLNYGPLRIVKYDGNQVIEFNYDALNYRTFKFAQNKLTSYVYDIVNDNLITEFDNMEAPFSLYIYGSGLVCRYDIKSGKYQYYISDFRGSTTAIYDEKENLLCKYGYGPWGELLFSEELVHQPFKYVGRWGVQYDTTNLYFMGARCYNPFQGRFISEDPIWNTNLFPYADNNPISKIDPNGTTSIILEPLIIGWNQGIERLKSGFSNRENYEVAYRFAEIMGGGKVKISKSSTNLPRQLHHFATNKSKAFTPRMAQIADEFGLSLNGAWNKQTLPHLGRHPNKYHNFVLEGMQNAKAGAGASQTEFLSLFDKYVKQPVIKNPSLLRKSGW